MVCKEVPGGPRLCEALVTPWMLLFSHAQDLITLDRIFLGLDFGELSRSRRFFQKWENGSAVWVREARRRSTSKVSTVLSSLLVAFCNILNELYVNTCRAANCLHVLGTELVPGKRGRLPTQLLSLAFLSTLGLELPHEISSPVVATVLGRTS